jgi:hypothetical protein
MGHMESDSFMIPYNFYTYFNISCGMKNDLCTSAYHDSIGEILLGEEKFHTTFEVNYKELKNETCKKMGEINATSHKFELARILQHNYKLKFYYENILGLTDFHTIFNESNTTKIEEGVEVPLTMHVSSDYTFSTFYNHFSFNIFYYKDKDNNNKIDIVDFYSNNI